MIPYLRLIRLPNVFTALADIIVGYFLATCATRTVPNPLVFAALCLSSATLYLSGMAFNDIADRDEDARVRPTRPIPSGAVSLKGAIMCAGGLMFVGIQVASWTGRSTLVVAAVLALAILAYDFLCKGRTLAGPLALGVCRASNILLGMSAVYNSPEVLDTLRASSIWGLPWLPALASGLYGAGVTAFSAQEETGKSRGALILGWVFTGAGLIAAILIVFKWTHNPFTGPSEGLAASASDVASSEALQTWRVRLETGMLFLGMYGLCQLARDLVIRTRASKRLGTPDAARALVLEGLKGYFPLDAAMLLLYADWQLIPAAVAIFVLSCPGGWLRKWLAQHEA